MTCLFCPVADGLREAEFYVQDGTWVAKNPILTGKVCRLHSKQFNRVILEVAT